jgi:phage minor structural protein
MTPVLFAANETQFNSMGIGVLADTISAHVSEERNGAFELEFIYPVDGPLFGELQKDRIVKAKANDDANMDSQLFRIYYISKPINGQCTYKAEHVSYELGKNPITSVNVTGTAQQFMNAVLQNTIFPHRFTAISDDPTTSSSSLIRVSAREAFGGTTGSLIQIWGGELTFDNWLIRQSLNRGTDTGIIVGYGKNLTDLNQEEAIDTTYTSIYPYATIQVSTGEGDDATTTDQAIELPEKYVESPYVGNYAYGRCLTVDLSGDDVTDEASLRAKAQQYIVSNDIGKPTVNLTVSFINLWQTEEYKNIAPLEHINLCDYVTVRFKKLGVDVKAKVIKTDYDVLADRYLSVELGDPKSNLADDINGMQSNIADVSATANQAAKVSGYALTQANGKNKTYFSATEPTGTLTSGDLWYKIVNGQYTEMWRYNGISWNKILSADANDALNKAIDALTAANGKNTVYHRAAQPIVANNQDIWFRDNANGTVTIFVYQDGQWVNPIQDGVKAAQDQADTAVATADAASAQAQSAAQDAATGINIANAANSAVIAAQQTAGDAATQASNAWNKAQDAWDEAQLKADANSVYTKTEIDNALTGYASTTAVNTLTGRVDQAETAINENENAISLKADKSTVNTLSGQLSTMSAELTTQAGEIAARITFQDADAKYATQTALTATSSSLTSSISAVNNRDMSNLCPNPMFSNAQSTGWTGLFWVGHVDNAPTYNIAESKTRDIIGSDSFTVKAGEQLYAQTDCYAINENGAYQFGIGLRMIDQNGTTLTWILGASQTVAANGATWKTISGKVTVPNNAVKAQIWIQQDGSSNFGRWRFTNVYVSKSATTVQFSQLSQTVDGISTTVSQKVDQSTYNTYVSQTATTLSAKLNSSTAASTYATQTSLTATSSSLQTNINSKVDTATYNSKISQLSTDINLRVSKNDVVNQINVSTESILIAGQKVHITGQTTIDNAVITNAMIATIDIGKATTGTLDANRIGAKTITVDKLDVANLAAITADLGWVTAGTLNAVNINGGHIEGASYHFQTGAQSQYFDGNGIDLYNSDTNDQIHLSTVLNFLNGGDLKIVLDSSGLWSSYKYDNTSTNHTVQGGSWFNVTRDGTANIHLRHQEDIINGAPVSFSEVYLDPVNGLYMTGDCVTGHRIAFFDDGGTGILHTDQNSFDLVSNGEVRVGIHTTYVLIGTHLEVDGDASANAWNINSLEELKTDINEYDDSALSVVNNTGIYFYKYKSDVEKGVINDHIGPIIGSGYDLPDSLLSPDKKHVDDHSAVFTAFKAIQELSALHQQDILKIADLESRLSVAESKIASLMEAA